MKMYILIKDDAPAGFAVLAAAHASLAAYLKFKDTPEVGRPNRPIRLDRFLDLSSWPQTQ